MDDAYKLVWSDEFDGEELDLGKWTGRPDMAEKNILLSMGKESVSVKEGKLCLNTHKYHDLSNPQYEFSTCYSIGTYNTMNFKYGYVEMRAKVPYMTGAWPSFWMKSQCGIAERKAPYMSEVDIFEVFSSENTAVPNLHKWYLDGQPSAQIPAKKRSYTFEKSDNLSNEFHTYGMEWTHNEMSFFIDGNKYFTADITENGNFDKEDKSTDMSGFHDCMYLIINNFIFTDKSSWLPVADAIVSEDTKFPIQYEIDYVRLYQKDGVGELHIASKGTTPVFVD